MELQSHFPKAPQYVHYTVDKGGPSREEVEAIFKDKVPDIINILNKPDEPMSLRGKRIVRHQKSYSDPFPIGASRILFWKMLESLQH